MLLLPKLPDKRRDAFIIYEGDAHDGGRINLAGMCDESDVGATQTADCRRIRVL